MKEFNSFEENNPQIKNKIIINPYWKWDRFQFIDPADYEAGAIPSYYDAPLPDKNFVLNGPVNSKNLKVLSSGFVSFDSTRSLQSVIYLKPGQYSINGKTKTLFASETNKQIWPAADTLTLTSKINNSILPELATYTWENDIIVIKNKWIYRPATDLAVSLIREWRITGNDIELPQDPRVTYVNTVLKPSGSLGNADIFLLPEFPVVGFTISEAYAFTLDALNGIIYVPVSEGASLLTASYDTSPLFSYLPKTSLSNRTRLHFYTEKTNDYFITIKPNPLLQPLEADLIGGGPVPYLYYRLLVTVWNDDGGSGYQGMGEMGLYDDVGNVGNFGIGNGELDIHGTSGTASTNGAQIAPIGNAFNGVNTDFWLSNTTTDWVKFEFDTIPTDPILAYMIQSANSAVRYPNTWKLQGSLDDAVWVDLDERSGETASSSQEAHNFIIGE